MRWTADEVAAVTDGVRHGADVEISQVTVDSRDVAGGELFVPVVADRDGHDFIEAALAAGAAAYLTSRPPAGGTAIAVADTGAALLALGTRARGRLPDRVIGITGSVGKTSVKDLTAGALQATYRTAASPRSFNNELGVPLTLANAADGTEAVVVEMGARGHGQVELLCNVARPTIGVVTTVALAHTEFFGSVEEVARAKAELIEALPAHGSAVLNADQELVAAMARRTTARVLTFGDRGDLRASDIELDPTLRPSFRLRSPWGDVDVALGVRGRHQVANALAAAGAALAADVPIEAVAAGLATARLSPWRMALTTTPSGATVLNDAYNANPTSMEAALRALAALPARRRTAVLGVMAELGPSSVTEHARIAALAAELGIAVIAVGSPDYGPAPVADIEAALVALGPIGDGDAVLVKGSRVAALERLAERLVRSGAPR